MRLVWIALMGLWPALAAAETVVWMPLTGDEVQQALTDRKLQYDSAWQEFRASGRTLYNAGADSWGYWRVRGDQYCSQWPPSDLWACYGMARSGDRVRFIGAGGDITDATYAD
ncbi:hypothetical protein [uncultured Roseobacter sp.]|uniref:hypothetical protein n=1 Tax=uncultured Roseobacter sp. TaxID=114847 RepID=UPI00260A71A0|nr:hypothetical protein [uncultured Roseobacter sp.]